jgi:hypothetical protein
MCFSENQAGAPNSFERPEPTQRVKLAARKQLVSNIAGHLINAQPFILLTSEKLRLKPSILKSQPKCRLTLIFLIRVILIIKAYKRFFYSNVRRIRLVKKLPRIVYTLKLSEFFSLRNFSRKRSAIRV